MVSQGEIGSWKQQFSAHAQPVHKHNITHTRPDAIRQDNPFRIKRSVKIFKPLRYEPQSAILSRKEPRGCQDQGWQTPSSQLHAGHCHWLPQRLGGQLFMFPQCLARLNEMSNLDYWQQNMLCNKYFLLKIVTVLMSIHGNLGWYEPNNPTKQSNWQILKSCPSEMERTT